MRRNNEEYFTFKESKYKTPDNYVFKHNGNEYTAIFDECVTEDYNCIVENRTYIMHDNKLVGYLRHHFIPKNSFKNYIKNPFDYFALKREVGELTNHPQHSNGFKDKPIYEKIDKLSYLLRQVGYYNVDNLLKERIKDEEGFELFLKEFKDKINKHYQLKIEYKKFKKCYESSAIIDFSHIRAANEQMNLSKITPKLEKYANDNNINIDSLFLESSDNYQRQGLATIMYQLTADWLALNNMCLQSSQINEKSLSLWNKMIQSNPSINQLSEKSFSFDTRKNNLSYLNYREIDPKKKPKI